MKQYLKPMSNNNLHTAKKNKNDEFYTQLSDIEKELQRIKIRKICCKT